MCTFIFNCMYSHCRKVGILYIKNDCTFKIDSIPLSSVRPFVVDDVHLKHTGISPQEEEEVKCYLQEKVESMINRASTENGKLPLIRLKVRTNVSCCCKKEIHVEKKKEN